MSDKAEIIYNMNMTKSDKVEGKVAIKKGAAQIDVIAAFNVAQSMLNDGLRPNARQVIYYMTNADAKFDESLVESFKETRGVIIVNDFVENGNINRPGLKELASPGYYHNDIQDNYMATIQLFCKANCYCREEIDRFPYDGNNPDVAVQAAGGCLRASAVGLQYSNAKSTCVNQGGGLVASIHEPEKAARMNQLMKSAGSKSDYFWIGYTKTDGGWKWEDQSTKPYENWDRSNGEPSQNSVAKCTYVDSTTPDLLWGAGNCNTGFPFLCEFPPCAAGNNKC